MITCKSTKVKMIYMYVFDISIAHKQLTAHSLIKVGIFVFLLDFIDLKPTV